MVVQIFVSMSKGIDPLSQQAEMLVFYLASVAGIGQTTGGRLGQAEPTIDLAKQENAAIGGDCSAAKINLNPAALTGWKSNLGSGTVCHGETYFVFQLN